MFYIDKFLILLPNLVEDLLHILSDLFFLKSVKISPLQLDAQS